MPTPPSRQEPVPLRKQYSLQTTVRHPKDPTSSPHVSPHATPGQAHPPTTPSGFLNTPSTSFLTPPGYLPSPSTTPKADVSQISAGNEKGSGGQTRLQATFEAIKKMGAGLKSPQIDFGLKRSENKEVVQTPGYFDVTIDAVEAQ
ncbi:hypothetical protein N0V90_006175 [Kalmusia sp. IMI 367209]|nr:hypothetical protein N0V90_006175 [Kalmusia sp. IMI 367209]